MLNLRKILVTTDLSELSAAAIEPAFSLGLVYASRMYVLHVVENNSPAFRLLRRERKQTDLQPDSNELVLRQLEEFILKHVGPDRKMTPVVRWGIPEQEIVRFAEEEHIDLLVMATHGWTGMHHLLLGSVAEKVVRHSRVPVLTVKPQPVLDDLVKSEDVAAQLHLP